MRTLTINLINHSLRKYINHKNPNISIDIKLHKMIHTNALIKRDDSENKENIIIKKFTELNTWYMEFTGLDEVKQLQDRVIKTQTRLEKAQEERREVGKLLTEARKKATELQEQLHNTNRLNNVHRYLDLTKQETEMIKLEKELAEKFDVLDKAEREIFTSLSNAVRDSHEKEKAQSEYTKYWGIILSIIGTILGAVVSTMISTIRNHQIVNGINKGVEDKFIEIQEMMDNGNNSKMLENIINENNKLMRIVLAKLNETDKQIKQLSKQQKELNKTASYTEAIPKQISEYTNKFFPSNQQQTIRRDISPVPQQTSEGSSVWYLVGGIVLLVMIIGKLSG